MSIERRDLLKVVASSAAAAGLLTGRQAQAAAREIKRDVVIVGGGSAGTYAALRLRDMGKSVAIVETSDRLGGHAETYYDSSSGLPIDIGVIIFPDNALVRNYFGRFSQPLIAPSFGGGVDQFVDFRSGNSVDAYQPTPAEVGGALYQYSQILATRYPFLSQSGFQLPASGPILAELTAPFGDFVQSNGLQALVPTFSQFVQGFGPLLQATTLYVLKNMGVSVVAGILQGAFVLAPSGTSALYAAATAELDGDVFFGARIDCVSRNARSKVEVQLATPSGPVRIKAKRLLFTAPPLLSNLAGFDLDLKEFAVLSSFSSHAYWTGVVKLEGVGAGVSLVNKTANTPFNLPTQPGIYAVGPSAVPGLFNVKYGATLTLPNQLVKRAIVADIERVRLPGGGSPRFQGFATFKSHTPYSVVTSANRIRAGFYKSVEELQGRNDTFYAGAAFETHSSAAIWAFLEARLPTLFA